MSTDGFDENEVRECPYCLRSYGCDHELLVVDKIFRTADGGALEDVFNDRWNSLCEAGGDDMDERESFEGLLEEVNACADSFVEYDHESGPGMSTTYSVYYIESPSRTHELITRFSDGNHK